nr:PREDICTED: uncharacterized protein LOC107397679 [Tribolium castaneum]|eukprot:XP_015834090.1 PREDICTED: uncharacterized protein LOC107397679 [Tribolium castaneum]
MTDSRDPFIMLRRIFIDINSYKITKLCDFFVVTFHSLVLCLQLYYTIRNFDVNFLSRYGQTTVIFLFMTVSAFLSGVLEKDIYRILTFSKTFLWSLDVIGKDARMKLERKCQMINMCITCLLLFLSTALVINMPFLGNPRQFFISIHVFEEYFGEWSSLLNVLYFASMPYLAYHATKPCFLFVYATLHMQLQFSLIEEYLFQVYEIDYLKSWKYLQDVRYQREIGNALRRCIIHHIALKKS